MQYLVNFEYGFSKNKCVFDNLNDATQFAKQIKMLPRCKGISIYKLEYEFCNRALIDD